MLALLEYKCLDKLVLGKEVRSQTDVDAQADYDVKNRKVVMLIKLSVMNEMLPEAQNGSDALDINWNQ